MHVVLVDHQDSFTETLADYCRRLGARTTLRQSDSLTVSMLEALSPTHILLSPGPGQPHDYPQTVSLIQSCYRRWPMLGVCLGHQCLAVAFGATVIQATQVMHGKLSECFHQGDGLFDGLSSPISVMRYHSWVVDPTTLSESWQITAVAEDQSIMAMSHRAYRCYGVQFHPEAVLTEHGLQLMRHFLT